VDEVSYFVGGGKRGKRLRIASEGFGGRREISENGKKGGGVTPFSYYILGKSLICRRVRISPFPKRDPPVREDLSQILLNNRKGGGG